jgi:hypothetical protein
MKGIPFTETLQFVRNRLLDDDDTVAAADDDGQISDTDF